MGADYGADNYCADFDGGNIKGMMQAVQNYWFGPTGTKKPSKDFWFFQPNLWPKIYPNSALALAAKQGRVYAAPAIKSITDFYYRFLNANVGVPMWHLSSGGCLHKGWSKTGVKGGSPNMLPRTRFAPYPTPPAMAAFNAAGDKVGSFKKSPMIPAGVCVNTKKGKGVAGQPKKYKTYKMSAIHCKEPKNPKRVWLDVWDSQLRYNESIVHTADGKVKHLKTSYSNQDTTAEWSVSAPQQGREGYFGFYFKTPPKDQVKPTLSNVKGFKKQSVHMKMQLVFDMGFAHNAPWGPNKETAPAYFSGYHFANAAKNEKWVTNNVMQPISMYVSTIDVQPGKVATIVKTIKSAVEEAAQPPLKLTKGTGVPTQASTPADFVDPSVNSPLWEIMAVGKTQYKPNKQKTYFLRDHYYGPIEDGFTVSTLDTMTDKLRKYSNLLWQIAPDGNKAPRAIFNYDYRIREAVMPQAEGTNAGDWQKIDKKTLLKWVKDKYGEDIAKTTETNQMAYKGMAMAYFESVSAGPAAFEKARGTDVEKVRKNLYNWIRVAKRVGGKAPRFPHLVHTGLGTQTISPASDADLEEIVQIEAIAKNTLPQDFGAPLEEKINCQHPFNNGKYSPRTKCEQAGLVSHYLRKPYKPAGEKCDNSQYPCEPGFTCSPSAGVCIFQPATDLGKKLINYDYRIKIPSIAAGYDLENKLIDVPAIPVGSYIDKWIIPGDVGAQLVSMKAAAGTDCTSQSDCAEKCYKGEYYSYKGQDLKTARKCAESPPKSFKKAIDRRIIAGQALITLKQGDFFDRAAIGQSPKYKDWQPIGVWDTFLPQWKLEWPDDCAATANPNDPKCPPAARPKLVLSEPPIADKLTEIVDSMNQGTEFDDFNFAYDSWSENSGPPNSPIRQKYLYEMDVTRKINFIDECANEEDVDELALSFAYEPDNDPSKPTGADQKQFLNTWFGIVKQSFPDGECIGTTYDTSIISVTPDTLDKLKVDSPDFMNGKEGFNVYNAQYAHIKFDIANENPVAHGLDASKKLLFQSMTPEERKQLFNYVIRIDHNPAYKSESTLQSSWASSKTALIAEYEGDIDYSRPFLYGSRDSYGIWMNPDFSSDLKRGIIDQNLKPPKKFDKSLVNAEITKKNEASNGKNIWEFAKGSKLKKWMFRDYLDISLGKLAKYETIAYKIVKRKGRVKEKSGTAVLHENPPKDTYEQYADQVIYIYPEFKDETKDKSRIINYIDTQVKMGVTYAYDLYAVVLVYGTKYTYDYATLSKHWKEITEPSMEDKIEDYQKSTYDPNFTPVKADLVRSNQKVVFASNPKTMKVVETAGSVGKSTYTTGPALVADYFGLPGDGSGKPPFTHGLRFVSSYNIQGLVDSRPVLNLFEVPLLRRSIK